MQRQINLLIAACVLSGCAATGHSYSEHLGSQAAPAPGNARMVVYRTGEDTQGSARDARISVDGKTVGKVAHMGFSSFEVAQGSHVLTADLWDIPGACKVQFDVRPNVDYYFEVTPRVETIVSAALLGALGQAMESAGKECGGAFAIVAQPKEIASSALEPLKLTQ